MEDKNVMAKKVQNQFSPGLRMSSQKRAADDSKPTGAHTSHIHKNRRIRIDIPFNQLKDIQKYRLTAGNLFQYRRSSEVNSHVLYT